VVKVHPELVGRQLPRKKQKLGKKFWAQRYEDINAFERHLVRNGTVVLKFFLNVSRNEQKARFLERLGRAEKHWKFSAADLAEREFWDDYMAAYEDALRATSTRWAPWYVIPADSKWVTRAVVADIVTTAIRDLDLKYPVVTGEQEKLLDVARAKLAAEE
jgi:polyphosphate kinase 2 (PPK2 family)